MRTGVYPGSFNPPTVAHLAVARAAVAQCRLDRLDLTISVDALGKPGGELDALEAREEALRRAVAGEPTLAVRISPHRLLVDVAAGYDVLVCGADKWGQLLDASWYGSEAARDEALARLPLVAVAPRPPHPLPASGSARVVVLDLDPAHHVVSATAVRRGRHEWRAPGA